MSDKGSGVVTKGGFTFKRASSLSLKKPPQPLPDIRLPPQPLPDIGSSSFASNSSRPNHQQSNRVNAGLLSQRPSFDRQNVNANNSATQALSRQSAAVRTNSVEFSSPTSTVVKTSAGNTAGKTSTGIRSSQSSTKSGGFVQTSIKSFSSQASKSTNTTASKPVATVAPHRSPTRDASSAAKRKRSSADSFSAMFVAELDDLDDLQDFDTVQTHVSPTLQNSVIDAVVGHDEDNSDVEIPRSAKRRRRFIIESDEESLPSPVISVTSSQSENASSQRDSTVVRNVSRALSQTFHKDKPDPCQHPLLSECRILPDSVGDFHTVLLHVMDEVCEIVGGISSADLMSVAWNNYERLQKLMATRKRIKDKVGDIPRLPMESDHHKHASPRGAHTTLSNLSQTGQTGVTKSSPVTPRTSVGYSANFKPVNKAIKSEQTPVSNMSSAKNSTPMTASSKSGTCRKSSPMAGLRSPILSGDPSGSDSPIPCGESFFEDNSIMTQSHHSYINTIKKSTTHFNVSHSGDNSFTNTTLQRTGNSSRNKVYELADSFLEGNCDESIPLSDNDDTMHEDYGLSSNIPIGKASKGSVSNRRNTSNLEYGKGDMAEFNYDASINYDSPEDYENFSEQIEFSPTKLPELEERHDYTITSLPKTQKPQPKKLSPHKAVFSGNDRNDGETGEFSGVSFPHSSVMAKVFKQVFGLREFREGQLQAINAALLGNDCFILMPTGGGKSLCYQLPALVTRGVTIVVSPLRALIQDQVQRLVSLDIPAAHLSGDADMAQTDFVYRQLYMREPGIKLLYVTPEKISASPKLVSTMENLFNRKLLDRFIIDEAHCVSQWGHDFRPDYKKLNMLRSSFPGVPMMALTATATPRVRKDVIHQLSMHNPKWFMCSFNRPNLKYSVKPKKPSLLTKAIAELIKTKFKGNCGIVYCLSRKECDNVAAELRKSGILASAYHAGLRDEERIQVQEKWINGDRCKVVCATIAFGMGIDKPDVRFVLHYSLPKSVEGYYQEAGRAGRDGHIAECILFYNYQDVKRLRRMIEMDRSVTYESKKVHIDNLFRMVQYCENIADCRRAQVLHYFGEVSFDRAKCGVFKGASCDACTAQGTFQLRDVTDDAKEIVKCVKDLTARRQFTLLHFVEIFKGSQNTRITELGHTRHPLHGRGSAYSRGDAERLFRKLVLLGVLLEDLQISAHDQAVCYIRLGKEAPGLMTGQMKVEFQVQGKKKLEVAKIGKEAVTSKQKLVEDCYKELIELAKEIAKERHISNHATVFPNVMLWQIAEQNPLTAQEMVDKVDGMPMHKFNKYGAHRFLDITTKYCVMYASIAEESGESQSTVASDEWASHYFSDGGGAGNTSMGKKKGFFKKKFGYKKKGKGGKSAGRGSSRSKAPNRSGGNSSRGGTSYSSTRGSNSSGRSRGQKSSSLLGFMPVPQPTRSFLSGGTNQYFG